jgi:hypothetical protein
MEISIGWKCGQCVECGQLRFFLKKSPVITPTKPTNRAAALPMSQGMVK